MSNSHYVNEYIKTQNNEIWELIVKKYPTFDKNKFYDYIFTKEFINHYGVDFLVNHIEIVDDLILEYGMNKTEKSKYIFENEELLYLKYNLLTNEDLTIDDLKQLKQLLNNKIIRKFITKIQFVSKENIKEILSMSTTSEEIIKILESKTSNLFVGKNIDILLKIINDKNLLKYLRLLNDNYFHNLLKAYDVINTYIENRELIQTLSNQDKEIFNSYINDPSHLKYKIKTKEKLYNYNERRFNYIKNLVQSVELDIIKNEITLSYFHLKYDSFVSEIETIENIYLKTNSFTLEERIELSSIKTLTNLQTKNEIINYISKHKNLENYIENLNLKRKELCKNELSKKINTEKKAFKEKINELNGENFTFLVHKIAGVNRPDKASELYDNISIWEKSPSSYISTSLINQKYMGTVNGIGTIFGFNTIKPDDILDMGLEDIFTETRLYKNNIENKYAKYLLPDDFINQSTKVFNEVVLKRKNGTGTLKPDFIVCFDKISEKDIDASNHFNVPIVKINSQIYLNKMKENLNKLLEENKYEEYLNYLVKTVYSYLSNNEIMEKYFTNENLINMLNELIENHYQKSENKKKFIMFLKNLIKQIDSINRVKNHYQIPWEAYDKEKLESKVNNLELSK